MEFGLPLKHHQIKSQMKQAQVREQAIELLMKERRAQLEFEILKQGEENFELYLESNSGVFSNVKKTYGSKISEKMKTEQKQEFINMIREQYEKRYNEIKTTHYQILDVDSKLDEWDNQLNEVLPNKLKRAEQEKADIEDRLVSLTEQRNAFIEAENDWVNNIEELFDLKKEEIYHQNNEILRDNNFENIKTRLKEVKEAIAAKNKQIEKNTKTIEETDAGMFDRNTKYSVEETQMRARLDNLLLGEKEIKQTVKPQLLNLKNEIKELNHEIINDKKKMEGIEDKIQKCIRSLELAKDAYIEKFGLDPDEITGSPVKKTEFEYTKEYEKYKNLEPEEFKIDDEFDQEQSEVNNLVPDDDLIEAQPVQRKQPAKKIESVSLDLTDLINLNMKANQDQIQIEEETDDDFVNISLMNNPTKLKINTKGLSEREIEFVESIRPLLEGKEIYK